MKSAAFAILTSTAITSCAAPSVDDDAIADIEQAELGLRTSPQRGSRDAGTSSSRDEHNVLRASRNPPLNDPLAAMADPNGHFEISSTATAPDGSRFVAGEFSGKVTYGGHLLQSRGESDVFVAHILTDGTVAWVQVIGSTRSETGPRVTFSNDRVKVRAQTNGAVDCGGGPLASWSNLALVFCAYTPDGDIVYGGTFPTL